MTKTLRPEGRTQDGDCVVTADMTLSEAEANTLLYQLGRLLGAEVSL